MTQTVEHMLEVLGRYVDEDVAHAIMDDLCKELGGANLYLPIRHSVLTPETEEEIADAYLGTRETMLDICRRYKVSYNNVYVIVRRVNARRSKRGTTGLDG